MKNVHLFISQFFGFDETLMKVEHDYGALQTSSSRKWERQVIFQENVFKKNRNENWLLSPLIQLIDSTWFEIATKQLNVHVAITIRNEGIFINKSNSYFAPECKGLDFPCFQYIWHDFHNYMTSLNVLGGPWIY